MIMPINPIKVLTIGRFYPPNHGGIERHIDDLLHGLGRLTHADCIVVDNNHSAVPASLSYHLYKVSAIATIASTSICPSMLPLICRLYKQYCYDILHLHFPNPMAHLAAYFLPKNVKLVITWHSDIIKQKNLLKLYQPFLKHILKRTDAIIAATPAHFESSEQLKKWGNSNKFHVIPYSIDISQFNQPSSLASAQLIKEKYGHKPILFSVGRHVYYKGFEYLIRAMEHIHQDAILILGGAGPLTNELQALARTLNLEQRIAFLGHIADEQLAAYYHAANLFCMPSVEPSEAFGLVQIEAMACKLPVISCELNNGVSYVNQHNKTGLIVPPRDPLALAQAITTLLQNDALRLQLGNNAYQRVAAEFTQENMWQKTFELYKGLLS